MATTTKRTNWKTIYSDLPTHVAEALRTARLKPEQVIAKTDGELMAIEGIKEEDVNSIRAIYTTESVAVDVPDKSVIARTPEADVAIQESPKKVYAPRKRSIKYKNMAKQIKKENLYNVTDAVAILAKLAKSTKLKTVELHLNMIETGLRGELKLSHSTGKDVKIAIWSDAIAEKITGNTIDFDMLLCTPADMPKIARYAKVLGPKGLMPNPKSGTVTEHPEKRAAELAAGGTLPYKTEAKFPIIHLNLGSITQKSEDLVDNINEAIRSINVTKIKSAYLSCTHTPSVKLAISNI